MDNITPRSITNDNNTDKKRKAEPNVNPTVVKRVKKRRVLSMAKKMDIIKRAACGESMASIGRVHDLKRSTVWTIVRDRDKIVQHVLNAGSCESVIISKKRSCAIEEMETCLIIWLQEQLRNSEPLSTEIIKCKARSLFNEIKARSVDSARPSEFLASAGWYARFKKRMNVQSLLSPNPSVSADADAKYPESFPEIFGGGGCSSQHVGVDDHNGFVWNKMPLKTIITTEEDEELEEKVPRSCESSEDKLSRFSSGNASDSSECIHTSLKMSVSIKAYLLAEATSTGKDEIRRFAIDPKTPGAFQQLKEKIVKIFLIGQHSTVVLQWKDEEGDLITVSSDEELISAMQNTSESIFRIFVRLHDTKSAPSSGTQADSGSKASTELHAGVTCDGCEGPIYGFRYKCMECPDYDLCQKCESKCTHPHHTMCRMPKPLDPYRASAQFMPFMFGRHGMRHGRHGRHAFSGCPRRRPHKHDDPNQKEGEGSADDSANEQAKYNYPFQFQQVLDKIWTTLGGLPQQQNFAAGNASAQGQGTDANHNQTAPQDFLRTVGETVAAMLDPLGIDVDVNVEHGGVKQPCGTRPTGPTKTESKTQSDNSGNKTPVAEEKTASPVERQEPIIPEAARVSISTPATTEVAAQETQLIYPALSEDPIVDVTAPNATLDNENGDWTYIEDKERALIPPVGTPLQSNGEGGAIPKNGPPTTSIADEINLMSAEPQHPNPTIRSALNQMMAMGFSNEGGWLTQLLEVKNGNIDSVLDVLTPVARGKK